MSIFKDLFGSQLLKKGETVSTIDALKDKQAVAIYFSAHWCPPCRSFTPVLAEKYTKLKEAGKNFEIVFASSDQNEEQFKEYYQTMPWLALPFSNRDKKQELATKYNCRGIPYLVVLDGTTTEVITTNGRGSVSTRSFIEDFPWPPKAAYDISESMEGIDENISLVIIQNYAESSIKEANSKLLLDFATNNKFDKVKKFFTINTNNGTTSYIRDDLGLPIKIEPHEHELKSIDNNSMWFCDGCRKRGQKATERHRCHDCDFDYCEECIKRVGKTLTSEQETPIMVLIDLRKRLFYKPCEEEDTITTENL